MRSEPQTQVKIHSCIFEDNLSTNIGVIFNRGSMSIESSTFNRNSAMVRFWITNDINADISCCHLIIFFPNKEWYCGFLRWFFN